MRVLQLNSLMTGGGADNQTVELCLGLRDLGVEVTLGLPQGCRLEPLMRQQQMDLVCFKKSSFLKNHEIRTAIRFMRQKRPAILHVHHGRDYWPAIIASRLACSGTRVVISRHLMTRPRRLSRLLLLTCSDVVAVSQAVMNVLEKDLMGPRKRLHLLYGGVDTDKFSVTRSPAAMALRQQQGWNDNDVVFGVVGACALPRGKGQMELLQALAGLNKEFPQARCAVVGNGTLKPKLQEFIETSGLAGSAVLLPYTDDIGTMMSALDVLVHPAVGSEALGLVILEALASGKPVIASRLDGIPEAFIEGKHGFLIAPGDATELEQRMRDLLRQPGMRTQFGRAGREWVCERFSRKTHAEGMLKLYHEITG